MWSELESPAAKLFLFLLGASREKLLAQTTMENRKKKGYVVLFFLHVSPQRYGLCSRSLIHEAED